MAPVKFEEHIKDKLDKREINPSDRAWAEISAQSDPDKGGMKKRYYRIGIAASIIGLLILSMTYFNANPELDKERYRTVTAPSPVAKENHREFPNENTVKPQEYIISNKVASEIVEKETDIKATKIVRDKAGSEFTDDNKIPDVAAVNDSTDLKGKEKGLIEANSLIKAKIEEVVASVKLMEKNNLSVTDAEVDSLLLQAQKELFSEKAFRNNHRVDAMALLADVEGELDQTFREQIFEMLKEGYVKVKTAVASRNN